MYSEKFTTPRSIPKLAGGGYTAIFKGDLGLVTSSYNAGSDLSNLAGEMPFPKVDAAGRRVVDVIASLYVNVSGTLLEGKTEGRVDVRAIRVGTTDDTSCKDHKVLAPVAGGAFPASFISHPPWIGANPGGFRWEIRPGLNVATLTVNARYAKHYGIVLVH